MPSYTPHYNLAKPDVNNPDDADLWGGYLNGDMDIIDSTMYTLAQGMYPVGSLYFNASDATNPATLLGFGTWTAFGAGQIPIGVGSFTDGNGTSKTVTIGQQFGEYNHTLTTPEIPSHTHPVIDNGHYHIIPTQNGGTPSSNAANNSAGGSNTNCQSQSATTGISIGSAGGGGAHNNIQPSIGVYIWQRTA